MIYPRR